MPIQCLISKKAIFSVKTFCKIKQLEKKEKKEIGEWLHEDIESNFALNIF